MADLEFRRSHSAPIEDAVRRIHDVIDDFTARYSNHVDRVEWSDDGRSASANGKRFRARFAVDETQVHITVELFGVIARVLKPKVTQKITEQLDKHFPISG
jgi:hypothetical protein